jgi:hypothetical protein
VRLRAFVSRTLPGQRYSIDASWRRIARATEGRLKVSAQIWPRYFCAAGMTDVWLGKSGAGHRDSLLSVIGGELVAVRWKRRMIAAAFACINRKQECVSNRPSC